MIPAISILIITYNRPIELLALLENLSTQVALKRHVCEILVLNNASTVSYQPVYDFLQQRKEVPVKFIEHPENVGVARGRNLLIRQAQALYSLVLDDDVVFAECHAIERIAGLFKRREFVENNTAVITLNIHYYTTGERQQTAFPHKKIQTFKNKEWFLTYYFTGAAHLMRNELFGSTGLYPEDFFYGMEEYDLSYRILEAGYTLAYDNSIKVLHKESPAGRLANKEKLAMMWLNKVKVSWRYLPKQYVLSTALMWSLQYLKKTKCDCSGFFKVWMRILKIERAERKQAISVRVMNYLHEVDARLWY